MSFAVLTTMAVASAFVGRLSVHDGGFEDCLLLGEAGDGLKSVGPNLGDQVAQFGQVVEGKAPSFVEETIAGAEPVVGGVFAKTTIVIRGARTAAIGKGWRNQIGECGVV